MRGGRCDVEIFSSPSHLPGERGHSHGHDPEVLFGAWLWQPAERKAREVVHALDRGVCPCYYEQVRRLMCFRDELAPLIPEWCGPMPGFIVLHDWINAYRAAGAPTMWPRPRHRHRARDGLLHRDGRRRQRQHDQAIREAHRRAHARRRTIPGHCHGGTVTVTVDRVTVTMHRSLVNDHPRRPRTPPTAPSNHGAANLVAQRPAPRNARAKRLLRVWPGVRPMLSVAPSPSRAQKRRSTSSKRRCSTPSKGTRDRPQPPNEARNTRRQAWARRSSTSASSSSSRRRAPRSS